MQLVDYIVISAKHLGKRRLRTVLTVSGICVGMIFLTMMVSLLYGGKLKMDDALDFSDIMTNIMVSPHIETTANDKNKELLREVNEDNESRYQGIRLENLEKIRALPHVVAAETFIEAQAKSIRLPGSSESYMARISGTPISEHFSNEILAGRDLNKLDKNQILLTSMYLDTMEIENPADIIGKKVIIEIERNHNKRTKADQAKMEKEMIKIQNKYYPYDGQPLSKSQEKQMQAEMGEINEEVELEVQKRPRETKNFSAEVVGIVMAEEKSQALVPQKWAKEMIEWSTYNMEMNEENFYHMLIVKADAEENVDEVVEQIEAMGYGATPKKRRIEEMKGPVYGISIGLGVLALIALLIASIGVVNTMVMAIYERTREIGIMRATGANSKNIKSLFTIEAGVIGFVAGIFGVVIGLGLALLIQYIVEREIFGDGKVVNSSLFKDGTVDIVALPWWGPLLIVAISTFIGMLAGHLPAKRAAKMDPAEALRYE